ncbi:prohibitin family protein [Bernardetia sp.]|uniref:prohibitin family protein n=1 Tax=Bernardetia sp. TaxID=1937974 RepID=UPI0025C1BDF3|nr:prohibitin family protein [Bernardetia sp.]
MSSSRNKSSVSPKTVFIGLGTFIVIIVAVVFLFRTFVVVDSGKVGVVANFGAVQETLLPEGMHAVNPFVSTVIQLDVRVQKMEADASASSRDLQPVTSKVALNFFLSKEKANIIYRDLGLNYKKTIIEPVIQESIKSAAARYTAEELITKRPQVKDDVYEYIKKRLAQNNIIVTDFSIVDFNFSKEFNSAIELKQIAEQKALTAKNDLERIRTEGEQERVRAQAQADAQKLLVQSLDDELLRLKAIEKWDGKLPVISGGGETFVDIADIMKSSK